MPGVPPKSEKSSKSKGMSGSGSGVRPSVRPGSKWVRWTKRALLTVGVLAGAAAIGLLAIVKHYEAGLPSLTDLKVNYHPPQVTRILARDGSVLAELFTERRTIVSIKDLPVHVKLAVLAAEDATFYEHEGLNYWGIARAMLINLKSGKFRQGGSTITQQVVKNVVLSSEKTFDRKVKEALLSRKLEQELTKDEILEIYLNEIYFGNGRYGIEEAARGIFGKSAKDVTVAEAAMIAGVIRNPEHYSPFVDAKRSLDLRDRVLGQMREKEFLNQAQFDAAKAEPVHLAPILPQGSGAIAPEVVELVRKELHALAPEKAALGGFTVTTTIDRRLQELARKSVRDDLILYDKRHASTIPVAIRPRAASVDKKGKPLPVPAIPKEWNLYEGNPTFESHRVYVGEVVGSDDAKGHIDVRIGIVTGTLKLADYDRYNPNKLAASLFAPTGSRVRVSLLASVGADPTARVPLRLEAGPEGALVSLDIRTREILALVGNYEAFAGGLDRATQSRRQPGSTFKPILYSYAIHTHKFTPASLIDVQPGVFAGGYKPSNYEGWKGTDALRLREALANSVNIAAVRVMEEVGPAGVVDWANAMGIASTLKPDLSLALGSYEVHPLELAGAYATIAGGGMYQEPKLITRIVGPDGKEIEIPSKVPAHRVLEEAESYVITSMMRSVIDHGTGVRAKELGRPIAGKTGTSNQAKDTWFSGFSTDIVTTIWVGYDDGKPLGGSESGATTALPGWIAFMKGAHEKKPAIDFPMPAGVVTVPIDTHSGLRAYEGDPDVIEEVFLSGTEPMEISAPWDAGVEAGPVPIPATGNVIDPDAMDAGAERDW